MPPHSLTNIEITQYYQNETRFIGIFSRDNFLRDEYKDSGTHWIASFCNKKQIIYFDSFGVLLKGVTETTKNELKSQNGGTLYMLLGTLGASLLGNLLSGKGLYKSGKGANF